MPNLNKVMLMGNLTRDPELRYTPNNTAVANLGLAINRRYKSGEGEQKEETTFIDCEAWGRTAEVINQYLKKGRPVYIEGRLKLDQWQDKDGGNRSKLKVVVETFEFIDSRGGGGGDGAGNPGAAAPRSAPQQNQQQTAPASAASAAAVHEPIDEGDIPF